MLRQLRGHVPHRIATACLATALMIAPVHAEDAVEDEKSARAKAAEDAESSFACHFGSCAPPDAYPPTYGAAVPFVFIVAAAGLVITPVLAIPALAIDGLDGPVGVWNDLVVSPVHYVFEDRVEPKPVEVAETKPAPPPPPPAPAPPPPPAPKARIVLRGVNFSFDSAGLDTGSKAIIEVAAEILEENPEVRVRVEGYTDSTGPAEYNMELSRLRAQSVRNAMETDGISGARLEVEAFGETDPIATNNTLEGRRLNRRVQLVVLGQP